MDSGESTLEMALGFLRTKRLATLIQVVGNKTRKMDLGKNKPLYQHTKAITWETKEKALVY